MEVDVGLILSIAGTAIGAVSFILARVGDARKLEHRLTAIEEKINPIWNVIIGELPKLLIKEDTPRLDELLRLAINGRSTMTDRQIHEMTCLLDEEYEKSRAAGDSGRAIGIALFRATLKEERVQ